MRLPGLSLLMPRSQRCAPGGSIYHALNRAVARLPLFKKERYYVAFLKVVVEALVKHPTRILSYCALPNHWHFVLWPRHDGEKNECLRRLMHTLTMRWHTHQPHGRHGASLPGSNIGKSPLLSGGDGTLAKEIAVVTDHPAVSGTFTPPVGRSELAVDSPFASGAVLISVRFRATSVASPAA